MNPRSTVVVLLLLAALGAYVYWVELPSDVQKADEERLLGVEEDDVTGITLTYPDHSIALTKGDEGWRLTAPVEADADATAVKNLVHAIAAAKITRTLEDVGDKLGPYGLDEPAAVLALTTADGTEIPALKVGETTAVGFSSYVQRGDDPDVYITTEAFRSGMLKEAKDLRDKRVLRFEDQDVRRIELEQTTSNDMLTLERPDSNTDWTLTTPREYPADGAETRSLLASARGIRATDFLNDVSADELGRYGLDAPSLSLTIETEDGTSQTLLLGGDHEDEEKKEIYAKRADGPTVFAIAEFARKNLDKGLQTLRDKTVVRFDVDAARTIEVTRVDGAGFTLTKADDGWHIEGDGEGTERAPTLSRFVDDLHGFKANLVVGEGVTDLTPFRLDAPELTIAITDVDGNPLGTLIASGGEVGGQEAIAYVAEPGSGTIYAAKPYVFQRINKKAEDFREAPKPAATPAG